MKYTKVGRLKTRNAIEKKISKNGYISLHQAVKLAERHGIEKRATVVKIFNTLKNVDYLSIWNPGTIHFFNKIRLCPIHCNTVVAKRVERAKPRRVFHSTFCTYDASRDEDFYFMVDILTSKKYKRSETFPPMVREYFITIDRDRRLLFWLEEKGPGEDRQEHMQEEQDALG